MTSDSGKLIVEEIAKVTVVNEPYGEGVCWNYRLVIVPAPSPATDKQEE